MDGKTATKITDPDIQRKITFLQTIFGIGSCILLFFATNAMMEGRTIAASLEYIVASSFIYSFFHVRYTKKFIFSFYYLVIILGLLFYYLTLKEGINHALWGFVFPSFAMFLLGT